MLFSVSVVFKYLFPSFIKSCDCLPHSNFGFVIHGYLIKCGFGNWVGVGNSLIHLYVKFGHFWDAYHVFEEMSIRDEDLFHCLVSGFGSNGFYGEVLVLFEQMVYVGLFPSSDSTFYVIMACSELGNVKNMGLLPNFDCPSEKCQVCVESKFSKPPFHSVDNRVSKPLDLIHTDICDMKSIPSRGGNKYFITFIDYCSRYCYVYLFSSKDEVVNAFKTYKAEVETQLNKKIKIIRSDRGGEYEFPFEEICTEFGIVHQMTAPYTPQSNGVAERKNRSLKETMNALLNSSGLPQNLWGEAVLTTNFILNRVPHRKTQQTPYEKWKGRMPNLNDLKVWGCLAKVAVPKPKKVKVGPKTIDCVFIRYAQNSNAYRFLVHKLEIPNIHVNTIIESRDASFFENIFPYNIVYEAIDNNKRSQDTISRSDPMEDELRRSKRQRTSTSFGPDFLTYLLENEPRTFKEAVT